MPRTLRRLMSDSCGGRGAMAIILPGHATPKVEVLDISTFVHFVLNLGSGFLTLQHLHII